MESDLASYNTLASPSGDSWRFSLHIRQICCFPLKRRASVWLCFGLVGWVCFLIWLVWLDGFGLFLFFKFGGISVKS